MGTTFSIKTGIFTITRRTKKGRKAHGGITAFYLAGQNPRTGKISPFFLFPVCPLIFAARVFTAIFSSFCNGRKKIKKGTPAGGGRRLKNRFFCLSELICRRFCDMFPVFPSDFSRASENNRRRGQMPAPPVNMTDLFLLHFLNFI